MTPVSLADLGLSEEEIAALEQAGLTDSPAAAPAATPVAAAPAASDEPELTPFSLADLGLSDEEIAALDLDGPAGTSVQAPGEALLEDTNIQPFSLDDLDLNDTDAFDFETSAAENQARRELGLTEEELASLDLGDLEPVSSSLEAEETPSKVDTGDAALDRLINLGQRQGFVDLTDIISVVEDPEAEAERIEEIGWILHRAGIEIRDGDEVIDMEAEEVEEYTTEPLAAEADLPVAEQRPVSVSDEPDLTPFSLSDLGLTDEEIAALGLAEVETSPSAAPAAAVPAAAPAATPPPSGDEPDLTPFSLSDLGLTDEEIASLGLAEVETSSSASPAAAAPTVPAATPPSSCAVPDRTPFSLRDLALPDEELPALVLA